MPDERNMTLILPLHAEKYDSDEDDDNVMPLRDLDVAYIPPLVDEQANCTILVRAHEQRQIASYG